MKKKKKKLIYWIVAVALIVAMVPLVFALVFAVDSTGVKFDVIPLEANAYKLVFSAKSPNNISLLNTIFSFDNTVIQPINKSGYAAITITDGAPNNGEAFKTVAADASGYKATLGNVCEGWIVSGGRTAFNWTVTALVDENDVDSNHVPKPGANIKLQYVESNGEYQPMFEFYFSLMTGKTVANITATTFNFEQGTVSGNFVSQYNNSGDTAGIRISATKVGDVGDMYWWGSNSLASTDHSGPNTIDEVINPFASGSVAIGFVKTNNPKNETKIELIQDGSTKYSFTIAAATTSGQVTQGYSLGGVANGTYTMKITKPGHLSYTKTTVNVTGANFTVSEITLMPGDINNNGSITAEDLGLLISDYGKSGLSIPGDIDGNGSVTAEDLGLLIAGYGKSAVTE